ncbi:hypothetical protein GCM10010261_27880 [Streptomyces pilosus]|uniref:hypothetical protein n=1 Tax=Streptomyces pilosus TaxID=28893 RepID=UPI00167B8893|nr:hypothetical protein [Streptomyces pilosus]GGV49906.1 hypothetical protein GCM10010261_27880 [Streptomyces pilosus]
MSISTLLVLGAAGGLLRGALDVYTRFVSWQADRRAHRQLTAMGAGQGEAPRFQVYFDPAVDIAAAVVHSLMGAGAAVLFGTTGQISGQYAAVVVGMSAPMLLTQLGRIQSVNDVVTGDRPAGAAETAADTGAPATGAVEAGGAGGSDAGAAVPPVAPQPGTATLAAPSADPVRPSEPAGEPTFPVRPTLPPRRPTTVAGDLTREPMGEPDPDRTRSAGSVRPGDTPFPVSPADGTGSGVDDRGAPRWRQGRATGEEGR